MKQSLDSDPILDFSGLASRNIKGSVSISREAGYDSIIGFYQIQYHNGDDYAYVDGYGLFKELNTDVKQQTIGIWKDDKLLGSW